MQIGIAGLGLIGGSLAKAVKERTGHMVLGFDQDDGVMQDALACGAIDGVLDSPALKDCRIVLVALYPQAAVDYILAHKADFGASTIVADCCGVKEVVCRRRGTGLYLYRRTSHGGNGAFRLFPFQSRSFLRRVYGADAAGKNRSGSGGVFIRLLPGTGLWPNPAVHSPGA